MAPDRTVQRRIARALVRLAAEPLRLPNVTRLAGADEYRLHVGDWRVVYTLCDDVLTVLVIRIAHRREVYRRSSCRAPCPDHETRVSLAVSMPHTDHPSRGISLAVLASVLFAVSDTTAKVLSNDVPVTAINWVRYVIFVTMAAYLTSALPLRALWPAHPGLQVARALAVLGSATLFIYGVQAMTIAQAITISFLSPLLITILSIPMLGEHVGPRRWAAVGTGMLGVLLVVRPGLEGFQPAALFGVASATCWSVGMILTRRMAGVDAPETTVLWSAVIGLVLLTILLPFDFHWPTPLEWVLLLGLGAIVSLGQWFTILAHRFAPASLLAPFSYSQLIWVTISGYLVFGDWPDAWTFAGAAVIIASGLYIAHRERVVARARDAA